MPGNGFKGKGAPNGAGRGGGRGAGAGNGGGRGRGGKAQFGNRRAEYGAAARTGPASGISAPLSVLSVAFLQMYRPTVPVGAVAAPHTTSDLMARAFEPLTSPNANTVTGISALHMLGWGTTSRLPRVSITLVPVIKGPNYITATSGGLTPALATAVPPPEGFFGVRKAANGDLHWVVAKAHVEGTPYTTKHTWSLTTNPETISVGELMKLEYTFRGSTGMAAPTGAWTYYAPFQDDIVGTLERAMGGHPGSILKAAMLLENNLWCTPPSRAFTDDGVKLLPASIIALISWLSVFVQKAPNPSLSADSVPTLLA